MVRRPSLDISLRRDARVSTAAGICRSGIEGKLRYHKLRIGWSVFWGLAAVLLIALWVRSYWWVDGCMWSDSRLRTHAVESNTGRIICFRTAPSVSRTFTHSTRAVANQLGPQWFFRNARGNLAVRFPYWCPVVIFGALSISPWLIRSMARFSLRTMLIVTMLVAAVLGLIVGTLRG